MSGSGRSVTTAAMGAGTGTGVGTGSILKGAPATIAARLTKVDIISRSFGGLAVWGPQWKDEGQLRSLKQMSGARLGPDCGNGAGFR